jgi:hypothetical protein
MYFTYSCSDSSSSSCEVTDDNNTETTSDVEVRNPKTTTSNEENSLERTLTPLYLGSAAALQTPHIQTKDPEEGLDL